MRRRIRSPSGVQEPEHTTHYSVVDAEGNAVSVTTTLNGGFGSHVTAEGLGFLMNNEMDDFAAKAGRAEYVRADSGPGECGGREQASAVGDDADDCAERRQAVSGAGIPGRSHHHHYRRERADGRGRLRDEYPGGGERAALP